VGLGVAAAVRAAEKVGLGTTLKVTQQVDVPAARVLAQNPRAGASLAAGSALALDVAIPLDSNRFLAMPEIDPDKYYRDVDPDNQRTTLEAWKAVNGYGASTDDEAHAIYTNNADLGFGRRMAMRSLNGRTSFYVQNYASVEDAAADRNLIATVAMEYSPPAKGVESSPYFTKFFAFGPDGKRITRVDLDGRGPKSQPGVCLACHGGGSPAPDAAPGDLGARFIPFDLDSFRYSTQRALTRADQEPAFKRLNQAVAATFYTDVSSTGAPVAIPDGTGQSAESTITIGGQRRNVKFVSVAIGQQGSGIEHPFPSDLTLSLIAPDGTAVTLIDRMFAPEHALMQDIKLEPAELVTGLAADPAGNAIVSTCRFDVPDKGRLYRPELGTALAGSDQSCYMLLRQGADGNAYALKTGGVYRIGLDGSAPARIAEIPVAADEAFGGTFAVGERGVVAWAGQRCINGPAGTVSCANQIYERLGASAPRVVHQSSGAIYDMAYSGKRLFLATGGLEEAGNPALAVDIPTSPVTAVVARGDGALVVSANRLLFVVDPNSGTAVWVADSGYRRSVTPAGKGLLTVTTFDKTEGLTYLATGAGENQDIAGLAFDDAAPEAVDHALRGRGKPAIGVYRPSTALDAFAGKDPNGTWRLRVQDRRPGDAGRLVGWSLRFSEGSGGSVRAHGADLVRGWYQSGSPTFHDDFVP
jgi:subtilisin-like proprotein convertase family protein